MTPEALGATLHDMYENAKRNEAVCQIHLFGIIYGEMIRQSGIRLQDILTASGLSAGYLPELSKGVKLAKYVRLRQDSGK